jgi:hypothetical protein
MRKKISQRSAVKLKRRVKELEAKLEHSNSILKYGWGIWIESLTLTDSSFGKVKVADLLNHAVLLRRGGGNTVDLIAVKYV